MRQNRLDGRGRRRAPALEWLEARVMLFGSTPHHEITATALSFINSSVMTTIQAQHEWQDKHDPNGDIAAYHFDGCYFTEGALTINSRYQTMVSSANPNSFASTTIATEFGRMLHAAQDFYAHSNWVEDGETTLVEPGLGMWDTFAPYSIHNGAMLIEGEAQTPTISPYGTAHFSRNGHVVTVSFSNGMTFPGVISGTWVQEKEPDNIEVPHSYLNKDYSTRTGFQAAHDLAVKQTQHEFQRLGALIKAQYGDAGVNKLLAAWVKSDQTSQDAARALLNLPPDSGSGGGGGGGGSTSQPITFINSGDTWKYLDNGSDQGSTWRGGAFEDSSWKSGKAELGYGDGDEATVVSYGARSSSKYITTYFRKTFAVTDPSKVTALTLSLVRDDGAIVYLNGNEIFRSNMPSGTVGYKTLASDAIEDANWKTASVNPTLLVSGNNVISVEIHQAEASSSDISFNFKLAGMTSGTVPTPDPTPTPTPSTVDVIPAGDTWKYLDNGSNQGSAWAASSFDDSSWKSGKAELGYGDGDETTVVGYGGNSSSKYVTTYFRKSFNIDDPSKVTGLLLNLVRDDGAVVYLNGTEIYRTNMPSGSIGYTTLASDAIEDTKWYSANVNSALLRAGSNVLAVEIHQADRTSSDISFNCSLTATVTSSATGSALAAPVTITATTVSAAPLINSVMSTESTSADLLKSQASVL